MQCNHTSTWLDASRLLNTGMTQGLLAAGRLASRCLWDTNTDSYTQETFTNVSF